MADQPNQSAALICRALTDQAFRERLKHDPVAALRECGIAVPEGLTVQVHEADAATAHIVLPALPPGLAAEQLSEEELNRVAGGAGQCVQQNTCQRGTWCFQTIW